MQVVEGKENKRKSLGGWGGAAGVEGEKFTDRQRKIELDRERQRERERKKRPREG